MDCPKCKSSHHVKDGIVHGKQRHRCKDCLYRYTVARKSSVKSQATRRLALELYLEGFDFRTTGRILEISYGTVYQWVKGWGSHAALPRRDKKPVEMAELDSMLAYLISKKDTAPYRFLLIDLESDISIYSGTSS